MREALVHVDEQSVKVGIPAGIGFKEQEIRAGGSELRLAAGSSLRVVQAANFSIWSLVDVEEAPKVYAVGAEPADIQDGIFHRLKFHREAALDTIRLAMVLGEADNGGRPEKAGNFRCVRVGSGVDQGVKRVLHGTAGSHAAGKSEELAHRIQRILFGTELRLPAAGGLLAGQ